MFYLKGIGRWLEGVCVFYEVAQRQKSETLIVFSAENSLNQSFPKRLSLIVSHFISEHVSDLSSDSIGFILLVVTLENPKLVLVGDGESNQRRQQGVLHAPLQLPLLVLP